MIGRLGELARGARELLLLAPALPHVVERLAALELENAELTGLVMELRHDLEILAALTREWYLAPAGERR